MEFSSFFKSKPSSEQDKVIAERLEAAVIEAEDSAARLAVIDDFEQAGIGWIWASDDEGRLIYLSDSALETLELAKHGPARQTPDRIVRNRSRKSGTGQRKAAQVPAHLAQQADGTSWCACCPATQAKARNTWWAAFGPSQVRRRRQVRRLSRQRQGRHGRIRAQDRGFAARRIRFAHRPRQPAPDDAPARKHACRIQESRQAQLRADDARPRPVQAGQRHDGPPGGRRTAGQVAERLRNIIGDRGEIGRLGGDEFQVILPDHRRSRKAGRAGQQDHPDRQPALSDRRQAGDHRHLGRRRHRAL